jgi:hypothetical protein
MLDNKNRNSAASGFRRVDPIETPSDEVLEFIKQKLKPSFTSDDLLSTFPHRNVEERKFGIAPAELPGILDQLCKDGKVKFDDENETYYPKDLE